MSWPISSLYHSWSWSLKCRYRKTSNISRTLVGNKIVDNSDVVGASPVGAAPTTSSFSTWHLASMDWAKTTARGYKKQLKFGIWCDLYWRFYGRYVLVNWNLQCNIQSSHGSGGRFKKAYELLNLRALKFSPVNKMHIFQCMGKIFWVEFQRVPLKFHTKYLTHTLKDTIFIQHWNFKSSWI